MRFEETKRLNEYINSVDTIFADDSLVSVYSGIENLETASLQGFSIDGDRELLSEISSVLSVIIAIIRHPHISNKEEETVLRIEQATRIEEDEFRRILQTPKLWRQHGLDMIPEQVYHYQYTDEIRIYENRFIGLLISMLDKELLKYSNFYLSKLPTLGMAGVSLDDPAVGEIITEIDRLRRKAQYLMNTSFYKEVSVGKPISKRIHPTNILIKDRLYCYCYRFYRKFVKYEDISDAKRDLCLYYFIHLLGEIKKHGYYISDSSDENSLRFEGLEFLVELNMTDEGNLEMSVKWRKDKSMEAVKHLLIPTPQSGERLTPSEREAYSEYLSVDFISLWELTDSFGVKIRESVPESALVSCWLESKTKTAFIDRGIYERYCPVCRGRDTEALGDGYICHNCGSEYEFVRIGSRDQAWFKKIGLSDTKKDN